MKRIHFLFLLTFCASFLANAQELHILSSTDLHSKLTGFGPENAYSPLSTGDDETLGGFARIATVIKAKQAAHPKSLLTIDAGDFLMGTIFHADEAQTGFQLGLMKKMGYDILTIGNHEFDYGPDVLGQIIKKASEKGEIPELTAAQMQFPKNEPTVELLKAHYQNGLIKPYRVFHRNGLKIGIFGLIGEDAVSVAPAAQPVIFSDMFETAAGITEVLRDIEEVDIIICLSHSGLTLDSEGKFSGEDYLLAEKVPDIDLIISGHTHLITPEPVTVGKTRIVQSGAYGTHLSSIHLNYTDNKIEYLNFELIKIDDEIPGDTEIHTLIEDYKEQVNERFFKPYGLSYSKPVAATNFDLIRSTGTNKTHGNLGNFVADAIKYYTDTQATHTDLSIVANGTIREHILKGEVTPADVFRILPLGSGKNHIPGNSLAMIYITPKEMKKLMEVIIMSNKPGTDSYLYISGAEVQYNPKKMMLRKVQSVTMRDKSIALSKSNKQLISITADTYLLQFVGRIKKMSKGLVNITPKDAKGNPIDNIFDHVLDFDKKTEGLQEGKQWLAVIEYMKSFSAVGNLPLIPEKYKNELIKFQPVKQ